MIKPYAKGSTLKIKKSNDLLKVLYRDNISQEGLSGSVVSHSPNAQDSQFETAWL